MVFSFCAGIWFWLCGKEGFVHNNWSFWIVDNFDIIESEASRNTEKAFEYKLKTNGTNLNLKKPRQLTGLIQLQILYWLGF